MKMKFLIPFRRFSASCGKNIEMSETQAIKTILGKTIPRLNEVLSILAGLYEISYPTNLVLFICSNYQSRRAFNQLYTTNTTNP